jgi:hypothetical protein
MMKIRIEIMCDQLECIYNAAQRVHHDHSSDRCEHFQPYIRKLLAMNGLPESYLCESKRTKPYEKQS